MKKNTYILAIIFFLTNYSFATNIEEEKADTMVIALQDFFKNDTMTIYVNGCLILENKILTSDTIMGLGHTGITIILINNTKNAVIEPTIILNLPCLIILTPMVKITIIMNGYKENFDIDLSNGVYIGFSKERNKHLWLSQSKIPFEYD